MAYETTTVTASKSQTEVLGLLRKFGAKQFSIGEGEDWAGVEFIHANHLVRVRCPLRQPKPHDVQKHYTSSRKSLEHSAAALKEREAMRVWRVLVWTIKARLVAVDEGLETFEQAFFSSLVDPTTGRTIWDHARSAVEAGALQLGGAGLAALGTGSRP